MKNVTNSIGVSVPPSVFITQLLPNVSSGAEADYLIMCFLDLLSGYQALFGIFKYSKGSMVNRDYYRFLQKEINVLSLYIDQLKLQRARLNQ